MLRFNDKQKVIINLIQIIIKSHKEKKNSTPGGFHSIINMSY
jgi:hypothetical protein